MESWKYLEEICDYFLKSQAKIFLGLDTYLSYKEKILYIKFTIN